MVQAVYLRMNGKEEMQAISAGVGTSNLWAVVLDIFLKTWCPSEAGIHKKIWLQGIERSAEMVDELYLQLLRHLRGSNKNTSVRGWELLLLAACACR